MMNAIWIALTGGALAAAAAMSDQMSERTVYHDPLTRIIEQIDEEVGLREEQREKITAIIAGYQADLRKYQKEHAERVAEIGEEMKRAHESGDAEAQRAARERMRALEAEAPSIRKVYAEISGVLNAEQRVRFQQLLLEERVRRR